MKLCFASMLVAALVAAPAMAEDMDVSKIKCKEFVAADKDRANTVLTWLEGFYTSENSPPILYGDKTKKDAQNLAAYCTAHGDDDLISAADAVMEVQ
jgi:hypothetical protein